MVTRAPRALAQSLCIGAYSINADGDAVVFGDVVNQAANSDDDHAYKKCDRTSASGSTACDLRKCTFMAKQPEVAVARVDTAILRCHCLSLAVLPQGITQ